MNAEEKNIILYDGYCNLCNATLQFILKHDKKKVFLYYPIQSPEGKLLVLGEFTNNNIPDSVILLSKGKFYTKSEAFFKILPTLGKGYSLLTVFKIIPLKLSDRIYDWIAAHRYKWFGKKDQCGIETS